MIKAYQAVRLKTFAEQVAATLKSTSLSLYMWPTCFSGRRHGCGSLGMPPNCLRNQICLIYPVSGDYNSNGFLAMSWPARRGHHRGESP